MANKYCDLSLNFLPNPKTGDISILSDEKSVNQSLRNLIFTNFYEIPFFPKIGSNVNARLFDLFLPTTSSIVKNDIKDVIENNEPRIDVIDISVIPDEDNNGLYINIRYQLRTTTKEILFSYFLSRII